MFSRITDAPKKFQEAAAIFLISTMVQRNWIFKSLPDTPIFNGTNTPKGKLLNVWFVILGKSRITRKTHVISNIESAIKKLKM